MTLAAGSIAVMLTALVLMPGVMTALLRSSSWRLPRCQTSLAPAVSGHVSAVILGVLFVAALALHLLLQPGPVAGVHVYALGVPLFVLALLDARYYWLPDLITLPVLGLGIAAAWQGGDLRSAVFGAMLWGAMPLALSALHSLIRQVPGMGLGDVKVMAGMGAWLGVEAGAIAIGAAALSALVYAALVWGMRLSRHGRRMRVPFGSALAVSFWTTALAMSG